MLSMLCSLLVLLLLLVVVKIIVLLVSLMLRLQLLVALLWPQLLVLVLVLPCPGGWLLPRMRTAATSCWCRAMLSWSEGTISRCAVLLLLLLLIHPLPAFSWPYSHL
jgi:hypothetical protein